MNAVRLVGSFALWGLGTFAFIALCELIDGQSLARYRSWRVVNDLLFRVFYQLGLYRVLLYAPVAVLLARTLHVPQVDGFRRWPVAVALPVALLVQDFLAYWLHRFQHTRLWWPFHAVHHSQETVTVFTGDRHHPFDFLLSDGISFIMITLGMPTITWLPFRLLVAAQGWLTHANLRWTFGPLGRVFVSPQFHSVHHGIEVDDHDKNFGGIFVIWDQLFGTASARRSRPERTGVAGYGVPEVMPVQLVAPIGEVARQLVARGAPQRER